MIIKFNTASLNPGSDHDANFFVTDSIANSDGRVDIMMMLFLSLSVFNVLGLLAVFL